MLTNHACTISTSSSSLNPETRFSRIRSLFLDDPDKISPPLMVRSGTDLPRKTKKYQTTKEKKSYDINRKLALRASKQNNAMVYLDGPQIYSCGQCRTHLTTHDDIISKSFHGRHGRAYLFNQCVNIINGPAEDRNLITGLHRVCDIICKRCKITVGWTYLKAYEKSQKYKEGKFIIEKINLHLEESDYYEINHPAGERRNHWKLRSIKWGSVISSERASHKSPNGETVYEYDEPGNMNISVT